MQKLVIHPKDRSTDFLKPIYHGRNDCTVITGGIRADVDEAIRSHDHIIMLGHGTPQGLLSVGQFDRAVKPKPSHAIKPRVKPVGGGAYAQVSNDWLDGLPEDDADDKEMRELDDWFQSRSVSGSHGYGSSYGGTSSWVSDYTSNYVVDDKTADLLRGKKLTSIWCNADQYMEWNELDGFYTGMFISETSEAKLIGTADTEQWQVDESNYAFVDVVRRYIDYSPAKLHEAIEAMYGPMAERNAVAKYNAKRMYCRVTPEFVKPVSVNE